MKRTLWLDMDGVIYNFIKGYEQTVGKRLNHGEYAGMNIYEKIDADWWASLELQPWAEHLLDIYMTLQGEIKFITRLPDFEGTFCAERALLGKERLCEDLRRKHGWDVSMQTRRGLDCQKFQIGYQNKGDHLLDDFQHEVEAWSAMGGVGSQLHIGFMEEYPNAYLDSIERYLTNLLKMEVA